MLVDAWAKAGVEGWELQIAGPDEDGHLAEVMQRIQGCGLQQQIRYVGIVEGQEKWSFLQNADLFILPSHSENFGVVVAEALACGLPVIVTRGTPWSAVVDQHCGWWVDAEPGALVEALRQATGASTEDLAAMGARGVALSRQFDWSKAAQATAAVYAWLLGHEMRPDCVHLA